MTDRDAHPEAIAWELRSLGDALACSQRAFEIARGLGFSGLESREISIVASELATNVTRHAGRGRIHLRPVSPPQGGIELIAEDHGPGIPDVSAALADDFSQGNTLSGTVPPSRRRGLGSGLGAIARLSDDLDIDTASGRGTRVRAFKRLPARAPAPASTLLLGLGNTLLTDDGVGVRVARHVAAHHRLPHVTVREAQIGGFALLDLLEGYDRAVIVDALHAGCGRPGDVAVLDGACLSPSLHLVAGHQIDLPSALALGRELGRPMPREVLVVAVLISDDRTFHERCTAEVTAAIPAAARMAAALAGRDARV